MVLFSFSSSTQKNNVFILFISVNYVGRGEMPKLY